MKRDYGKSLAFQKFTKTLESQIRNYWQIQTSLIYAERWWAAISSESTPLTLAKFPGDNKRPFTSIDISPRNYLDNFNNVEILNRENSIVNFITAFEVYLFDILKRILFLRPELVANSEMPIEAGKIGVALGNGNANEWFSQNLTDKYLRNLTHLKMLLKLQGIVKKDFKKTHNAVLEEWNKWTYVRNAIIHNGREVSEDLHAVWGDRYKTIGDPMNLVDRDFFKVHSLALAIGKIVDEGALEHHIDISDASLLIREFFIRDGIDDAKDLSRRVFRILNFKMKAPEVDKVLGYQRRSNAKIEGWKFSHYNFQE